MQSKLKRLFVGPVPQALRQGFYANVARGTWRSAVVVGALVLVFELVMIITSLMQPGALMQSVARKVYLLLYVILFVVTLVMVLCAILMRRALSSRPQAFLHLTTAYAVIICLWGAFMSAYAHRNTADISVYVYVSLCVAVILPLKPWQAIVIYLADLLAFILLMPLFRDPLLDVYSSIINGGITTLLCIAIASALYHSRGRDYLNRMTILQQNREIRNINAQLQQLVYIDNLTQAHNRRYMDEVLPGLLADALSTGVPVSILMLDFDHFKQYNDLYGHEAGDNCLVAFSGVVQRYISGRQAHYVRYGGEEFLLFLFGMGEAEGMKAAETIRQLVADAGIVHAGTDTGYTTVSIGVRVARPGEKLTLQQFVSDADQALYVAKNAGRNRVKLFYAPGRPTQAAQPAPPEEAAPQP